MSSSSFPPLLRVRSKPRSLISRILLVGAAVLCFVFGILGWLLPVITGIPFYILGLILLGMASQRVRDWINRAETKLSPRWRRLLRAGLAKIPFRKLRQAVRQ